MARILRTITFPALPLILLCGLSGMPAYAMSAGQIAKLIAPDAAEAAASFQDPSLLGEAVALDGDTALISARLDGEAGEFAGAAYVFTRNDGVWSYQQKLLAPDGAEDDFFGNSVALYGDTALIGARRADDLGNGSGTVYVFTRTDGVWTLQQKLLATDGRVNQYFGFSVALEGDTALIGASGDDENGNYAGAAYVFERSNGVWQQQQKLMASTGVESGFFGESVALDGDTVLIGGLKLSYPSDSLGSAYVFTRYDGIWSQQQELLPADGERNSFGPSIALDSDTALISNYVFMRSDGVWSETQKLVAPEATAGDDFGRSVTLSGDTALVGAPQDNDNGSSSGSVYLFTRNGDVWSRQRKILAADGTARDAFGTSVALDGDTALIGAPEDYEYGVVFGSAYVFDVSTDAGVDGDEDGVFDATDNCPADFNPLQEDFDNDREGDACDTDDDNDNILDDDDNCPLTVNTDQANFDNDGAGDICDEDDDNDGVPDNLDLDPFDPNVGEGIEVTISRAILSSADDVEQRRGGRIAVDSNDLELGDDNGYRTYVGLRFANLAIPQGAIILDARVLFWVDEQNDENTPLTLAGVDSDDATQWLSSGYNVSRRTQTNASINWSPTPWTNRGTAPVEQTQSPDLSVIVQEIVDRSGWQAGNAVSLVIEGSGRRVAYSYDQLSGPKAPMLTVRYATVDGNQAPSVELGSDLEVLQSDALTLKGLVQDDGLPVPPGTTSLQWRKLSGPGTVDFDDSNSATTAMTFSSTGRYELELRAFDGALIGLDRIIITVTGEIAEQVIERRIANTNDDVEEALTSTGGAGAVDLDSSDLELVMESTAQLIGLRFADLAIPSGATITRAWVQFTVDETRYTSVIDLTIHGESTTNAVSFEADVGNVSSRPRTEASVSWSPPEWERIDDVGEAQRTPDLSAIVQEIVDAGNEWQSGNSLVLLIDGSGRRVAESFDGEKNSAPLLHIEYQ